MKPTAQTGPPNNKQQAGPPLPRCDSPAWLEKERAVLETVRQHLREARQNAAIGKLTFEFEFVRGGIKGSWISCQVSYRYMENTPALEQTLSGP